MIDVRTYRESLYGSMFLRAKQVNTKSSRFQLSRTCPWFWLRTAWDCCICCICHVSKGLILSCPARLEFCQARIEQSFQSDMELSLWESWSLVHHVASFINCIITQLTEAPAYIRWCSCICRDIVDHNNLDFCHLFFCCGKVSESRLLGIWNGTGLNPWFGLDFTFQLCICEMTRSTTWHNWDGMMEPSRQVLVSIGAVDTLTLQSCRQEIYTIDELLEAFKMERMSKAWRGDEILSFFTDTNSWRSTSGILTSSIAPTGPEWSGAFQVFHSCFLFLLPASFCQVAAIFDTDKFKWVNGHHVRKLTDEEVLCLLHFVMFKLYSVPKDLQNLQTQLGGHRDDWVPVEGAWSRERGTSKFCIGKWLTILHLHPTQPGQENALYIRPLFSFPFDHSKVTFFYCTPSDLRGLWRVCCESFTAVGRPRLYNSLHAMTFCPL